MKVNRFVLVSCILMLCACQASPSVSPVKPIATSTSIPIPISTPTQTSFPLTEAQQYLSNALDIIQENAFNTKDVDWVQVRNMAFMFEKYAETSDDTYDTINYVLRQLGDQHSFFLPPDAAEDLRNSTTADYPEPFGGLIDERVGYIALYGFGAQREGEVNSYADNLQGIIIELSRQGVCGWIVDLRENTGGNMYPMIAGLGTLIGEGQLGSFKDAKGQTISWYYKDGHSWEGDEANAKVSHPEFVLDPATIPVAVLIGPRTASSGEATAISFIGRLNTQLFGQPSRGLTTGNGEFELSDGAMIILTTVVELDRNGLEYGGSIIPDVTTPNPEQDAVKWLLEQPACAD